MGVEPIPDEHSERTPVDMDRVVSAVTFWETLHERRWLYWLPVVGYAGLIFYLSSLSHPDEDLPSWFGAVNDKVIHTVEYGVLGILLYRAFRWAAWPWWAANAWWLAILGAVLYGATDEIHQSFVPLRSADLADLAADTVGALTLTLGWRRYAERTAAAARSRSSSGAAGQWRGRGRGGRSAPAECMHDR